MEAKGSWVNRSSKINESAPTRHIKSLILAKNTTRAESAALSMVIGSQTWLSALGVAHATISAYASSPLINTLRSGSVS